MNFFHKQKKNHKMICVEGRQTLTTEIEEVLGLAKEYFMGCYVHIPRPLSVQPSITFTGFWTYMCEFDHSHAIS